MSGGSGGRDAPAPAILILGGGVGGPLQLPVQVAGCVAEAMAANVMFALRALSISTLHRATGPHLFSEVIATAGLVLVIFALARSGKSGYTPAAVGAYITAAYFFTSSTSFANPAITVGRMFSDTFAGIAPSSVLPFIGAQVVGAGAAVVLVRVLHPGFTPTDAADIMVPHEFRTDPDVPSPPVIEH